MIFKKNAKNRLYLKKKFSFAAVKIGPDPFGLAEHLESCLYIRVGGKQEVIPRHSLSDRQPKFKANFRKHCLPIRRFLRTRTRTSKWLIFPYTEAYELTSGPGRYRVGADFQPL